MPELPEVETFARGLHPLLADRTIVAAAVDWPRTVALPSVDEFEARIVGQRICSVGRRGKYLILQLHRDYLLIHLKMSGRLQIKPGGTLPDRHTRFRLELDNHQQLRFQDPRKFGRAYLTSDPKQVTATLGPEPLADDFSREDFCRLLAGRTGRLKSLLLNQTFLAGLGNIYADEALFMARLHPLRPADSLLPEEQARLYESIRFVLNSAIENQGTTLKDKSYLDVHGQEGAFQEQVAVYGRKGRPCSYCQTPIERVVIGGRSACFCPQCQPLWPPL